MSHVTADIGLNTEGFKDLRQVSRRREDLSEPGDSVRTQPGAASYRREHFLDAVFSQSHDK